MFGIGYRQCSPIVMHSLVHHDINIIAHMSIGKTAYPIMVQMALGFQKVHSYTGVME